MALLSGYTAGADVLQFELQLTADGQLVLSNDETVERLTGQPGRIIEMRLGDLRKLDFGATYLPRGSTKFRYRPPGKGRVEIEAFPTLLDLLPPDIWLMIELRSDSSLGTGRRDEFVRSAVTAISERGLVDKVVLYSSDSDNLKMVKTLAPEIRIATFAPELEPGSQLDLLDEVGADGVVIDFANVVNEKGQLTATGNRLQRSFESRKLRLGALVMVERVPAIFTQVEFEALEDRDFVWSISTDSMLDVSTICRRPWTWLEETFGGKAIDTHRFALGYAKANKYAHVFQDDGIHVDIGEYSESPSPTQGDVVAKELQALLERTWYALKDWPFYSGGGVGILAPIEGDFAAEIDFAADRACQATMLEMALTNVDPGRNQPPWNADGSARLPATIRDKAEFYNPHGAPPFVGAEHDEDDGYRINWNLGAEYDDNQYGSPVGDGSVLSGRLRLERRNSYFSVYYRNAADVPDWVCAGAICNQSMNLRVFLRCAGKRWRQERTDDPSQFYPVVANRFLFRNLTVVKFGSTVTSSSPVEPKPKLVPRRRSARTSQGS